MSNGKTMENILAILVILILLRPSFKTLKYPFFTKIDVEKAFKNKAKKVEYEALQHIKIYKEHKKLFDIVLRASFFIKTGFIFTCLTLSILILMK